MCTLDSKRDSLKSLKTFSIVTIKVPARCTGQPLPSLETLSDPAMMSQAEAEHPALDAKKRRSMSFKEV